tara:strand:- start:187 stop:876 length:690 start_codon:yes stop_codon:yes gene_type:complete
MTILNPWGPTVYQNYISEEFKQFLLGGLFRTEKYGRSMRKDLVGQINKQREGIFDIDSFKSFIDDHVLNYELGRVGRLFDLKKFHNSSSSNQTTAKLNEILSNQNMVECEYDLLAQPWVNFQKPNEYNPIHEHTGAISAIIFIDIPEEIKNERDTSQFDHKTNGCLEFLYDCSTSFVVTPETGMIFIFPNTLKHCVYPYQSDVERITMSFNIEENPKIVYNNSKFSLDY